MSSFGLDYVTGPPVADLKAAGVTFVCRYLSFVNELTQVKLLTPDEAKTLGAAGIAIVSNYEWYANRALEGFASGVADAQIARDQHVACGGPPDRPIYFSVDADVDGSAVAAYFKGVASVIGLSRTGAYGSYRVLEYLFNIGDIAWGWQTYAWSGGAWEPRAHIQQYQNGVTMNGASVDYDRSIKSDFGQWFPGGVTMGLPPNWQDDGTTLTGPNGIHIVLGFRGYVLPRLQSGAWDAGNVPLAPQYYTQLLEASNPALGDGDQIVFLYGDMLAYPHNPQAPYENLKNTVIREWAGKELAYTRGQLATYYNEYKAAQAQIATMQPEMGKLKQEVADLQAQVQAAKAWLDPATVKDRLTAIGLAANNGNAAVQQLVNQPL